MESKELIAEILYLSIADAILLEGILSKTPWQAEHRVREIIDTWLQHVGAPEDVDKTDLYAAFTYDRLNAIAAKASRNLERQ